MINERVCTIYDVAKEAGVSPATVSRVINEPSLVREEKRQKVQEAIKKLRFEPKVDAVINARKTYKKIGVIAPFFTQPSFMERLKGVANVLASKHYELVIYSIDTMEDLENYIMTLVTTKRVDGLIFLCVTLRSNMLELLKRASFPVCFVENEVDNFDSVIVKNLMGGQKAAEFLYGKGCRNPGFIGELSRYEYAVSATEERFRGYSFYWANVGIIVNPENVWIGDFTDEKIEEVVKKLKNSKNLPDCIFCSSDVIAAKFIKFARRSEVDIPGDIKVLGYDNIELAQYVGLTSVNQNLEESGKSAAELILERIKNPERNICHMILDLNVVLRDTTGA